MAITLSPGPSSEFAFRGTGVFKLAFRLLLLVVLVYYLLDLQVERFTSTSTSGDVQSTFGVYDDTVQLEERQPTGILQY